MGNNLPHISLSSSPSVVAVKLAGGTNHACALLNNNKVKCWGDGTSGALGWDSQASTIMENGGFQGDALPYALITSVIEDVSAGDQFTCVLIQGGQVQCWGSNHYGQLGDKTVQNRGDGSTNVKRTMANIENINLQNYGLAVQVSCAMTATTILLDTGVILAFGDQQALSVTTDILLPTPYSLTTCQITTTQAPTMPTTAPTSHAPTSKKPTTHKPTTRSPTIKTTGQPTTHKPTTRQPTTHKPTTHKPTTPKPTVTSGR